MTEAKKRVSTLAKSYDIPNDLLLNALREAGLEVKSAMSMIDHESFAKAKPLILATKEKLEREALVRAGKKIPMKAVLKKAPPQPPTKLTRPAPKLETVAAAPEETQTLEKPQETTVKAAVKQPAPEAVPMQQPVSEKQPEAPEAKAPKVSPIEIEAPTGVQSAPAQPISPEATEPRPEPIPAQAPEAPKAKVPPQTAPPQLNELKVSVEKPDAALLARIARGRADAQARMQSRGQGYSGNLSRGARPPAPGQGPRGPREGGPVGAGGPPGARRPAGPGGAGAPRDVFAQRAHEAGVTNTFTPLAGGGTGGAKPDRLNRGLDKDKDKAKTFTPSKPTRGGHRRKSKEQVEAELLEARQNVSKVMASLSRTPGKGKLKGRKESDFEDDGSRRILNVGEFISIGELAGLMNVMPAQVIAKCMELGMMVTINQRLDYETIALIADEFGFDAKLMDEYATDNLGQESEDTAEELLPRAPIITVMGHVDHGKTSLLDFIRKANVIAGEAGGITQHIGAYQVETIFGPVCFLDTPGHEAFSAMRSRGAHVTDVVVLVVAADSMVMPQTKEAIKMAKNANCQIVVAISKIDLPTANPDKIRAQLAEAGVEVEQWGGKYPSVEISAKTGLGMEKLLETLALESEILDLKANPNRPAQGTVIESRLDKGKGAVATVLIQNGTLNVGDPFVTGIFSGKVRALLDERGKPKQTAGPSTPVQVLGLEGAPQAGDSFLAVEDEREAREIAARRRIAAKDRELRQKRHITLDQLYDQIKSGEFHELKVIIKGDVDGSVEAIAAALEKVSTKEVRVNVISKGVGAVTDADIGLASASEAIVIAFHVLPSESVRNLAEREGVTINNYRVIYEVVDEIRAAMEGMLTPEIKEEVAGEAEILQLFHIPKIGTIAGCKVQSGTVERDLKARLYRGGIEVGEAKVTSLKREKDDAKVVRAGFECGIGLEGLNDIKEGDVLAFFRRVEVARKLSAPVNA